MSLDALLFALTRHRGDARMLVDELREALRREPPDERTRRALRAELEHRGITVAEIEAVWSPGIGQGYVLLAGATGGSVGRLTVRRGGPPHRVAGELGGRARSQALLALDAIVRRLARSGRGLPEASWHGHEVEVSTEVDGSSLGVTFAAAAVSQWTQKAPSGAVAATAALDAHGRLVAVAGLEAKLAALADAYPAVRRVVVATEQEPSVEVVAGITLIRCATIEEALATLGLSLDDVRGALAPTSEAEAQITNLPLLHVEDYSAARWREHALATRLLATHPKLTAADAATATAFAALFHLHAGDEDDAHVLASGIEEETIAALPGVGEAWVRIVQATSGIDSARHAQAVAWAERAVDVARKLNDRERRDVFGRALGTLGRAKMHAGDDEGALSWLRAAAAHHGSELPREEARSLNTLANALRRAGRHQEALVILDDAARSIEANADERESAGSTRFMRYERGRVLFELDRLEEAYACFERVVLDQPGEGDYPRVGCLRYLAWIDASRGAAPRAGEWLEQALRVAERCSPPIGTIAATAAMVVVASHELRDLRERAGVAWRDRVGGELTAEAVSQALRQLVY